MIARLGVRDRQAVEETSALRLLIAGAVAACSALAVEAVGRLRPVRHDRQVEGASANSQSRSSWPGTAMIAPVP